MNINIVNVADIIDENDPQKRTFREINNSKEHKIKINQLVELKNKSRGFVVEHTRDCDGTPLYNISFKPLSHETPVDYLIFETTKGYIEEDLTIIND